MHRHERIILPFSHALPHSHQKRLDLHLCPAQSPRQRAQRDRAQPFHKHSFPVQSALLQCAVLGPRPYWHVEDALGHVGVAAVTHHGCKGEGALEIDAEVVEALRDEVPELYKGEVGRQGNRGWGLGEMVDLLQLDPASGFEVPVRYFVRDSTGARDSRSAPVRVFEQAGPVFNSHDNVPRVDEVEVIRGVDPWALDVVDHKPHVWWYPFRLDRGEVHPEDTGSGMLVAHCAR